MSETAILVAIARADIIISKWWPVVMVSLLVIAVTLLKIIIIHGD